MIKTALLILSDTHGKALSRADIPNQYVEVAIHCGDLTDGAKLQEFRNTIEMLKDLNAPLKLVIPGNHDFTMDIPAFQRKVSEVTPPLDQDLVAREYGTPGEAKQLFADAHDAGIIILDEGTHRFTFKNGASLTIYASPYTPALGAWGFQYHPDQGHEFLIEAGVDIVLTHGPPRGIMDYTYGRERAGCLELFAAVARARPRIHCFGHIHEGWGAKLVTWKGPDTYGERPSHFTAIDNEHSLVLGKLASLKSSGLDVDDEKGRWLERIRKEKCVRSSHCVDDEYPLRQGEQTLFVNASVSGTDEVPIQWPWLIDVELPSACTSGG